MTKAKTFEGYERTSRLTVGFTSMAHAKKLFCRINSPMRQSEVEFENAGQKSCPTVCDIMNMETGEESYLICSAIIESCFGKFKDHLVGKCFEIAQAPKIEGKKYRALDIFEINPVEPEE